jgi:hypothetical protein
MNEAVVRFSNALSVAQEFAASPTLPKSIRWSEPQRLPTSGWRSSCGVNTVGVVVSISLRTRTLAEALQGSHVAGDYSPAQASELAARAAAQRAEYGLSETAPVPRIPRRLNQRR